MANVHKIHHSASSHPRKTDLKRCLFSARLSVALFPAAPTPPSPPAANHMQEHIYTNSAFSTCSQSHTRTHLQHEHSSDIEFYSLMYKLKIGDTRRNTGTHIRLMAIFLGLPRWANIRKVKTIWILLKQETVCGSGISWAICKSAPNSRQITTPAPHHSVFYRPDAFPATQPKASKHWRH